MTDITKIVIAAEDRASEVFGKVQTSAQRLHDTYAKLAGAFTSAIGAGYFMHLIQGAIEAEAAMKELAAQAGVSAEAISRFDAPARMAGSSLDFVSGAMFKLGKAALDARDPASKAAQAFDSIGISAVRLKGLNPDQLFELIARQLDKYSVGLERNAVIQELFGKSGKEANKIISQIAESTQLAATVTNEEAQAASRLNSQMVELHMASEKFWRGLANDFVPALNAVTRAFNEGRKEGNLYEAMIAGVSAAFDQMAGSRSAANELARTNEAIRKTEQEIGNLVGGIWQRDPSEPIIKELQNKLDHLRAVRVFLEGEVKDAQAKLAFAGASGKAPPDYNPAAGASSGFFDQQMAAARGALAIANAEASASTLKLTEAEKELLKIQEKAEFLALSPTKQKQIAAMYQQAAAAQSRNVANKNAAESEKLLNEMDAETAKQLAELNKVGADRILGLQDEINRYQLETDAIGLTNVQREIELLDYRKKLALRGPLDDAQREAIEMKYEELKAMAVVRDARTRDFEDQKGVWTDLADRGGRFFSDLATSGKSAFDVIRNELKNFLKELLALFAKRWILQIGAAALAGTSAGGALATSAATSGAGSLAGSALSAGGSYIGSSALGTAAYGAVGMGAGGIPAAEGMGMAAAADSAMINGAAWMSTLGATGWGLIIVAAIAVVAYFADRNRGGPKGGGSFTGAYDPSGALTSSQFGNRLYTPANADPFMATVGAGIAKGYFDTLKQLGGTSSGMQFGIGLDTDPQGTAQNRITSFVKDALGNNVFSSINREIGRDDKDVGPALQLEAQRMILAALQASNLPKDIADILNSLTASSASADDINRVLQAAAEMKNILDTIGSLGIKGLDVEALKGWQRAGETIGQTFQRVGGAFAQFDAAFMSDAQKIAAAQSVVTSTFSALGVAIPANAEEFYTLVHSIDVSTEAGRHFVEQLLQVAPAFQTATQGAANAIAQLYNTAASMSAGFGAQYAQANLNQAAQNWLTVSGNGAQGWTVASVISEIAGLTAGGTAANPGGFADALAYVQSLGPAAVAAFQGLLGAYSAWQASMKQGTSGIAPITTTFTDLGNAAATAAQQLAAAKQSLTDYLSSLLIGNLSPLSPTDQLAAAQKQWESTLALAQGGDAGAVGRLSGASDAYLQLARQMFASSAKYVDIFNKVYGADAGVAGISPNAWQSSLVAALPSSSTLASQADIQALTAALRDYLAAVAASNEAEMEQQNAVLAQLVAALTPYSVERR